MLKVSHYNSTILTDIDFELKAGENLTILGANGTGKSTLAKVISGIIPSESVELFGDNLHTMRAKKRAQAINYVPPKLEIFDAYITLKEYLQLSRLYSDLSVDDAISSLGLENLTDKSCIALSSGEQQLALLASSLLHNAKLTIFDEPTANLDPQKTLTVAQLLTSSTLQNRIIITHDLNLAFKLGYKILYMLDGKIAFFDDCATFFDAANLENFFAKSLKRIDDSFVVNL